MLMSPFVEDIAQLVCDEKIAVITTGQGLQEIYRAVEKGWQQGDPGCPRSRTPDGALVPAPWLPGTEAGGHIGDLTTMVLIPQVVDAVKIPVVAAGGVADGRGVAAAFMLGASGVQLGTRFLACVECTIHDNYKQLVTKARDIDTVVTGRTGGHPVDTQKTNWRRLLELKTGASFFEIEEITVGSLTCRPDGDLDEGSLWRSIGRDD